MDEREWPTKSQWRPKEAERPKNYEMSSQNHKWKRLTGLVKITLSVETPYIAFSRPYNRPPMFDRLISLIGRLSTCISFFSLDGAGLPNIKFEFWIVGSGLHFVVCYLIFEYSPLPQN